MEEGIFLLADRPWASIRVIEIYFIPFSIDIAKRTIIRRVLWEGGEGGIERKEDRFFSKIRFFSLSLVPLIVVNILLIEFAYIEYISLGLRNIYYISLLSCHLSTRNKYLHPVIPILVNNF